MLYNVAAIIVGLILIIVFADRFVVGTVAIARNLGVSSMIIGLTIVGFGTSAPEMLVSGMAAWQGKTGLAVGNALGSNIANIGLILGCTAIISPITVRSKTLKRELPILLTVTIACYLLALKGDLDTFDGVLMLSTLVLFLFWLVKTARSAPADDLFNEEIETENLPAMSMHRACFWFIVSLLGLILSSRLLVWGAVHLAQHFGVSDLFIGLSIVALGTSLPELAASVASILKGEDDLAIGNVIGSNMYNLLAVYSLPGILHPGPLVEYVITRDFPWVIGFTLALVVMGFNFKTEGRINRIEGALLIVGFGSYQTLIFMSA